MTHTSRLPSRSGGSYGNRRLPAGIIRIAALVDCMDWLVIALAAPFLIFPSPERSLALAVIPAVWIAGWIATQQPLARTPYNLSMLLLALMVLVSLFATYDMRVSLPKVSGVILGFGVFYCIARRGATARGWWLAFGAYTAMALAMAAVSLPGAKWENKIGFVQPLLTLLPPRLADLGVENGFSVNELAGTLLWAAPVLVTLSFWMLTRPDWRAHLRQAWSGIALRGFVWLAALVVLGILVLTQSRSAYIGLSVAVFLTLFVTIPTKARWVMFGAVALLLIVGLALVAWQPDVIRGAVQGGSGLDATSAVNTWERRTEVWSRGVYAIQDFSFTGMGMNTFRSVVHVLYPFQIITETVDIAHAHNEYLQAALDLGIPGLIAFLALYLIAFWILWKIWRGASPAASQSANSGPRYLPQLLALGFACGLLAHLVYAFTEVVALGSKPGVLFWMQLGLIAALFEQQRSGRLSSRIWGVST